MKLIFLGTGTSQGVPVIGCTCDACTSTNPKDKRTRCSLYVEYNNKKFIIDIGPDFRSQMLTNSLSHLDFVLFTHEHNDHTAGLDDVRPINFQSREFLQVYGLPRVIADLRKRFAYVFAESPYPGVPLIETNIIDHHQKELHIEGVPITPILINHGKLPILGYRFGNVAYLTDAYQIPDESIVKLKHLDILIISALRDEKQYSHLTLDEAIELSQLIGAKKTYFIHMSHSLGPLSEWEYRLPPNIHAAYDGLRIDLKD